MTARSTATPRISDRQRTWLLFLVLSLMGGGAVAFAGVSLVGLASALSTRQPVVPVEGSDGLALLVGTGLLAIAVVCLTPAPDLGPKRRSLGGGSRLARPVMLFAAICMVLSPFGPSVVRGLAGAAASDRGYVRCPLLPGVRRQPDRWALPGPAGPQARCPQASPLR